MTTTISGITYNTYAVISADVNITEANIESEWGGNTITTISSNAFEDCVNLSTVTIPSSITTIEGSVFKTCTSLVNIVIPDSVTIMSGSNVFYGCTTLESVTFSDNITTLGGSVCYGCTSLTTINLPTALTTLGSKSFYNCSALTSVVLPDTLTTMGSYAFWECLSLTTINIPLLLATIADRSFWGCSALVDINSMLTNADSLTELNHYCFKNTGVVSVVIPDTVTTLGAGVFINCTNLTSVTLPSSVITLSGLLFAECSALETVSIPSSVTIFNTRLFRACTALTTLIFESKHAITIHIESFASCTSFSTVKVMETDSNYYQFTFTGETDAEKATIISNYMDNSDTTGWVAIAAIAATICFPAGEMVLVDGDTHKYQPIESLNKNKHTINGHKIKLITETVSEDDYLIEIKKDAIYKNMPNKTTQMSKNHQLLFQGKMIKAKHLPTNIGHYVKYLGNKLYNVILENNKDCGVMVVNGLIVETLSYSHPIAKLYSIMDQYDHIDKKETIKKLFRQKYTIR